MSTTSLLLVLVTPVAANAVVVGDSNLDFNGYPSHECEKPTKPVQPAQFTDKEEVESYNTRVEEYNQQMPLYVDCINSYVEGANNDIKRIREKIQEAMDEAKP